MPFGYGKRSHGFLQNQPPNQTRPATAALTLYGATAEEAAAAGGEAGAPGIVRSRSAMILDDIADQPVDEAAANRPSSTTSLGSLAVSAVSTTASAEDAAVEPAPSRIWKLLSPSKARSQRAARPEPKDTCMFNNINCGSGTPDGSSVGMLSKLRAARRSSTVLLDDDGSHVGQLQVLQPQQLQRPQQQQSKELLQQQLHQQQPQQHQKPQLEPEISGVDPLPDSPTSRKSEEEPQPILGRRRSVAGGASMMNMAMIRTESGDSDSSDTNDVVTM